MTGKVNTQHKQDFSSLIPKLKQQVESSWRTILTSFLQDAISECQSAERLTQVESVLSDLRFTQLWLKKNRTMVEMEVPAQLTHNLMSILTDQGRFRQRFWRQTWKRQASAPQSDFCGGTCSSQ